MARERTNEIAFTALMGRKTWAPLPAVAALHGDAEFFKREVEARFIRELFGDSADPWVRRIPAGDKEGSGPSLAEVLDDLRTPSFFSPHRLVILQRADSFLATHREALEPFVATGFGGGHLILTLDSLDLRTRFARTIALKGWVVSCQKPFDSPPPWQPNADPWDNDLCRWVAARAREKGLRMAPELAHAFCERVGSDLATLDEELEKLAIYLGPKGKPVDLTAVEAVAGQLREDSVFDLVDAFLTADRTEALSILGRLLRGGYHPSKGATVMDPAGIWSLFVGALITRMRGLRRAHALEEKGQGPEAWVALRLTPRPFLPRFQRDLRSTPPARIEKALEVLLEFDRQVKTGGKAPFYFEAFLLRC